MQKDMLKMDLQMFATDVTPEPTASVEPEETKDEASKTFTQEDVDKLIAGRLTRAQADVLKELGVESVDQAKQALAQLQEIEDSKKSELDKKEEARLLAEADKQALETQYKDLEAKFNATKLGVLEEALEDVIQLAKAKVTEDVTIEQAMKEVVEKYPQFVGKVEEEEKKPMFVKPGNPKTNIKTDAFASAFDKFK